MLNGHDGLKILKYGSVHREEECILQELCFFSPLKCLTCLILWWVIFSTLFIVWVVTFSQII